MMYRLIVLNGPRKGERITIDPEPMIIGRHEDCEIAFPDEEIAQHHARIEQTGNELFVTDLGSMNKIILNKHETTNSRIKHGDIMELGRTRLLVEAIVQAEVQTAPGQEVATLVRRGRKRKLALAASVLLVAGGTFALLHRSEPNQTLAILPEPAFVPVEVPVESALPLEGNEPVESSAANEVVDERIRAIQHELDILHMRIEQFNRSAIALASPETAAPTPAPIEIPGGVDEVEAIMRAARDAIKVSELEQAELLLEHLRIEHPDHLPGYELRAELYERLGMPGKAREQWNHLVLRTTNNDQYRRAMVERVRLDRAESQSSAQAHEAVRIVTLDQIRFRESSDYDEMRTVQIQLAYDRRMGPIDPQGMRLMIYFFEQDLDTRRVQLSAVQPYAQANLTVLQQEAGDRFSCAVNYIAPKGYYSRDHHTRRQRYYGFVARLHYFENLIDEQARPSNLLDPAVLEAAGLARHTANLSDDTLSNRPF